MVQEPAKHTFSREDEGVRPWPLKVLRELPSADGAGAHVSDLIMATQQAPFYPWSKFAVYRSGTQRTRGLNWPARLWMSNNHFRSVWSLRSHRRLKNVICAMEWQPPQLHDERVELAQVEPAVAVGVVPPRRRCDACGARVIAQLAQHGAELARLEVAAAVAVEAVEREAHRLAHRRLAQQALPPAAV